jgi:hypothetical protein
VAPAGVKKAGRTGFFRRIETNPYWAGAAGSAGAGSVAGGVAGAGAGSVVVASGTPWVVVVSVESLQAATLKRAKADTEARTSFFITISFMSRPQQGGGRPK